MKALLIATILAANPVNVTTEIGFTVNHETVVTEGNYWGYDTEIKPCTPVVVYFDTLGTETRFDDVILKLEEIK